MLCKYCQRDICGYRESRCCYHLQCQQKPSVRGYQNIKSTALGANRNVLESFKICIANNYFCVNVLLHVVIN